MDIIPIVSFFLRYYCIYLPSIKYILNISNIFSLDFYFNKKCRYILDWFPVGALRWKGKSKNAVSLCDATNISRQCKFHERHFPILPSSKYIDRSLSHTFQNFLRIETGNAIRTHWWVYWQERKELQVKQKDYCFKCGLTS